MDGFQFWSAIIGHVFSWPVAVIVVVLILRRSLGSLLGRLLTLSGPGDVTLTFSELLEKSGLETSTEPIKKSDDLDRPDTRPTANNNPVGHPAPIPPGERVEAHPQVESGAGSASQPDVEVRDDQGLAQEENLRSAMKQLGDWNRHARKRTEGLTETAYAEPEQTILRAWRFVFEYLELATSVVLDSNKPRKLGAMIDALLATGVLDTQRARDIATLNRLREVAKRNETFDSVEIDTVGALEYVGIAGNTVDQILTNLERWTLQVPSSSSTAHELPRG